MTTAPGRIWGKVTSATTLPSCRQKMRSFSVVKVILFLLFCGCVFGCFHDTRPGAPAQDVPRGTPFKTKKRPVWTSRRAGKRRACRGPVLPAAARTSPLLFGALSRPGLPGPAKPFSLSPAGAGGDPDGVLDIAVPVLPVGGGGHPVVGHQPDGVVDGVDKDPHVPDHGQPPRLDRGFRGALQQLFYVTVGGP